MNKVYIYNYKFLIRKDRASRFYHFHVHFGLLTLCLIILIKAKNWSLQVNLLNVVVEVFLSEH